MLNFFNKETGELFGIATVTNVTIKTLGTLTETDWVGHERYESDAAMYAEYRSYYGDQVNAETEVKIIQFDFEQKTYKKCVVVDELDNVLGAEYMAVAIEKGLIRRASRIYVFNESGQLLVQQRSAKVAKPLLLDQSAAGHVDEGESYEEAARRELFEELGLSDIPLIPIALSFRTSDFYNGIYKAIVPDGTVIAFDPEELAAVHWYNIADLNREMLTSPEKFTPAFKEAWSILQEKFI
ncbi:MAG: hypothetical protein RLZZ70_68 [Candidatus Parcubacteria bacterium]